MKHKIFGVVLLLLFSFSYAQEKKEQSRAGECCSDKDVAIAEMQKHSPHKHAVEKDSTTKTDAKKSSINYTCPMHPEVKAAKPGKCPKCGMNLVQAKPEKNSLLKEKLRLMKEGKYSCCIETPCDECLKAHGSCSCYKAVKNDKPVCSECYEGWKRGEGAYEGKTINDIKKVHSH
jgi:hypothetical protein